MGSWGGEGREVATCMRVVVVVGGGTCGCGGGGHRGCEVGLVVRGEVAVRLGWVRLVGSACVDLGGGRIK